MRLTRRRFEREYARRSGVTVREGRELGIFPAVRCDCDSQLCEGWRRRYEDDERIKAETSLGRHRLTLRLRKGWHR